MTTAQAVNSVTTGYETELWRMAHTLRGSMDADTRRLDAAIENKLTTLGFGGRQ